MICEMLISATVILLRGDVPTYVYLYIKWWSYEEKGNERADVLIGRVGGNMKYIWVFSISWNVFSRGRYPG